MNMEAKEEKKEGRKGEMHSPSPQNWLCLKTVSKSDVYTLEVK